MPFPAAGVLCLVLASGVFGTLLSEDGRPSKSGGLWQAYDKPLPAELLPVLRSEGLLHARLAERHAKHHKLSTNFYPLTISGNPPQPRFATEAAIHILKSVDFPGTTFADAGIVGAEWWYQLRNSDEDIPFHLDKDEAVASNDNRLVHPHLSTITYLTDTGAPTVILNMTATPEDDYLPRVPSSGALFFPAEGKHVTFHGSLLHGVAGPLGRASVHHDRRKPRITLLVNWWASVPGEPNCRPVDPRALQLYSNHAQALASKVMREASGTQRPASLPLRRVTTQTTDTRLTLVLPVNERLHIGLPATFASGANLELQWTPGSTAIGGIRQLDLYNKAIMTAAWNAKTPNVYLFYDADQDLDEMEKDLAAAMTGHEGFFNPYTAKKALCASALPAFGVDPGRLPALAVHAAAQKLEYLMPGDFNVAAAAQYLADFRDGRVAPRPRLKEDL